MSRVWLVQDGFGPNPQIFGHGTTPQEAIQIAEDQSLDFLGDPIDWTHVAAGTSLETIVGTYNAHAALRREIIIIPAAQAPTSDPALRAA